MTIKPLGDRVVIKSLESEETTKERYRSDWQREGKTADGGSRCSRAGRCR